MEEKGEKVNCECGSVVLKKNLASHVKTKKHQALAGPPSLHRNTGVSFADAQHTDRADVEDDDDGSEDDGEEEEAFMELFDMIEELGKAIVVMDKKLDNVFDRVEETRLKTNLILGQVREVLMALPNGGVPVVKPQDHA
jgi:hypothetical protein